MSQRLRHVKSVTAEVSVEYRCVPSSTSPYRCVRNGAPCASQGALSSESHRCNYCAMDTSGIADGAPVELPLLTVEEAAQVLRIGRSLAYGLARRYEASGCTEGLPVIRFGTCLRVPRWALMQLAHDGRVVKLGDDTPEHSSSQDAA